MTTPIEEIIPRSLPEDVSAVLNEFKDSIEEMVNFGSVILSWDLSRKGSDEDLPPVLFLRNFLENVDAISVLIKYSSVESCKILLRTALENVFYLGYILQSDSKNRALAFIVWNTINNNKLLNQADSTSNEYKELLKKYKNDTFLKDSKPPIIANTSELIKLGEKIFLLPKFLPIKEEYDNTKKLLKKKPAWYTLFDGPRTIEELANRVKLGALYEVLYRNWSGSIHGTNIIQGKFITSSDQEHELMQLRHPKDAQSITLYCSNLCLMVFKNYLSVRNPEKLPAFLEWYLTIRDSFNQLSQHQKIKII